MLVRMLAIVVIYRSRDVGARAREVQSKCI
jgi:hypothetical protein